MMLLSGYTLGFFFPKQAMHAPAMPPKAPSVTKVSRDDADTADVRPFVTVDGGEVPASFYFYRYF
jgi:hypothetical protein